MKRWLGRMLGAVLLLAGVGLLLYPHVRKGVSEMHTQRVVHQLEQRRQAVQAAQGEGQTPSQEEQRYQTLYEDMQAYNVQLYQTRQEGLRDAWDYVRAPFRLEEYGVEEAVGYLTIPAMNLQLPVYLGATRENLDRGAAVLGETSMPVGGENTNCVIAGHRGWRGASMFLEIEALHLGDLVQLDNLWGTLTYEVVEVRIIQPDEVEAGKIQEGRDLLTLVTCHPYPTDAQRYLVYCQRIAPVQGEMEEETPPEGEVSAAPEPSPSQQPLPTSTRSPSQEAIRREQQLNALGIPGAVALLAAAVLIWRKGRK